MNRSKQSCSGCIPIRYPVIPCRVDGRGRVGAHFHHPAVALPTLSQLSAAHQSLQRRLVRHNRRSNRHSQPVSPPSHLAQSRFPTCRQRLKLPGSHLRRPVRDPRQTGPSARPSRGAVVWEGLVLSETDGTNRAVA